MSKIKTTGRTVWVATSRYADDDSSGGWTLVGVGETPEAATEALELAIQSHNEDETFCRGMWIDEQPVQVPVMALR